MNHREVTFLVVEDDQVFVMAIRRAFKSLKIDNPVVIASDGVEALEILRGEAGREPLRRPYLVVLDLNLPRMDGIEFLTELRRDSEHHDAIVFVLTTSRRDEDRVAAYDQNVAAFLLKSDIKAEFMRAMDMIDRFWRVVVFP